MNTKNEETYVDADPKNAMDSAIKFEKSLRECLDYFMKEGLTVSNAVGTLALLQQEISLAFCVSHGVVDEQIKAVVFADLKKS